MAKKFNCDCEMIHEEVVTRVSKTMPDNKSLDKLSTFYKMFADNTRLKILWALSREDMCVCDLAFLLNMTKSAISHQLKALRVAKLVKCEKQGRIVYYSLVECHVRDIFDKGFEHVSE
ncbi:MAG: metalloregulator ArsR/SmtB family transcription factor [Erysipelotrichales bacterium]|nr:metalloregulator ArsR/SmtB family transcription factor [Erysipelotrichales bacterium]